MANNSKRALELLLGQAEELLFKEETRFAKWVSLKHQDEENFNWQKERIDAQYSDYSRRMANKEPIDLKLYDNLNKFDQKFRLVLESWKTSYDREYKIKNVRLITLRREVEKWKYLIQRIDLKDELALVRAEKKLADEMATNMWLRVNRPDEE